ncbi:hypothetical protein WUBG_17208 [Wuchereria bancrofti]|uniref:Uncharacterized protein n=1 Tax=Wuchereria bancrofti TaxID=6293 RepID=J9DQQ1_WUCBA|nr:hypothetical protein WUBG_17208 [Wuchereria bancrofti]
MIVQKIVDNNSKTTINANANELGTTEIAPTCDDSLIIDDESYLEYFICSQYSSSNSENSQQLPEMRSVSQESLMQHLIIDESSTDTSSTDIENGDNNNHIDNNDNNNNNNENEHQIYY